MKLKYIFLSLILITQFLQSQDVHYKIKIEYLTTISWETPQTYNTTLFVNDSTSLFLFKKNRESTFDSNAEKKTFNLVIGNEMPNFYFNKNGYYTSSEQIFNKYFIVKDSFPNIKWKITNESKIINNFTCKKATGNFRGRTYNVWFTEEIPISKGPWKLGGLPGLIVEVKDELNEVEFKLASILNINETIDVDFNNKKQISWEDFHKKKIKKIENFKSYMESSNSGSEISVKIGAIKSLETLSLNEIDN